MKTILTFFSLFFGSPLLLVAQNYPEMIEVKEGSFFMGNDDEEALPSEKPGHIVVMSGFKISKTEITVAQYRLFCNNTARKMPIEPSWGWKDEFPMVNVTWHDAMAYTNWLSQKMKVKYILPTEAQWEFAARGAEQSYNWKYSGSNNADSVAWFRDNSDEKPHQVGLKMPNELGLFDMSGNVAEWCLDWYDSGNYFGRATKHGLATTGEYIMNPQETSPSEYRVVRGGSWDYGKFFARVTARHSKKPEEADESTGFRVVILLDKKSN